MKYVIIKEQYENDIIDEFGNRTTFSGISYDKDNNLIDIKEKLYDIYGRYIGWPGNITDTGILQTPNQKIGFCFNSLEYPKIIEEIECCQFKLKRKNQIKIAKYVRNRSILKSIK